MQSNLYDVMHSLYLFNQTDSSWGVHGRQRFVLYVELRRFCDTRLTMGQRRRVSDASAVQLNHRKKCSMREAGGVWQGGWNFYSQWHSFWPQT